MKEKEKNNPRMQTGSLGPRNVSKVLCGQPDDPLSCISTPCKQVTEEREGKPSTKDYSWHVLELLLALTDCPIALGLKVTMEEMEGAMQPQMLLPHRQENAKSTR